MDEDEREEAAVDVWADARGGFSGLWWPGRGEDPEADCGGEGGDEGFRVFFEELGVDLGLGITDCLQPFC